MSPVERMTVDKIHTLPADLQQQILAFAEFVELRAKSNLDTNTQASTDLTDRGSVFGKELLTFMMILMSHWQILRNICNESVGRYSRTTLVSSRRC
jgi:hypothetical protein